nr:DDE-type integrase/transposase/recombinase [Veillonella montpellierensis]
MTYPGEKVQIDIKYVPNECLLFPTNGVHYYQITAIDEYSRKRVLSIVDEKSVTNTSKFLLDLEARMGFKIQTVQTDNGREFTNYGVKERECLFDRVLQELGIKHKLTRPFSPWQNGKVERSHKVDGERFYRRKFTSLDAFLKAHQRYASRYNKIVQKVLGVTSPNE